MNQQESNHQTIFSHNVIIILVMIVMTLCLVWAVGSKPVKGRTIFSSNSFSLEYIESYAKYRNFVTPEDPVITDMAAGFSDLEDIYDTAISWVYVSEQTLNDSEDKWLMPSEFLTKTPAYTSNPVQGQPVGDCEEQANCLVSLIRAWGVSPEYVRVVLGEIPSGTISKGHVWVELFINDAWLPLDPSQGPAWEDTFNRFIDYQGLDFSYYATHNYPVPTITAYYNDVYYLETGSRTGNAPDSWH